MDASDRRQYPRVDVDLPVTLRYRGRFVPAVAMNISCGGVALLTDDPAINDEEPVEVVTDLSYQLKDVALSGVVVRVAQGLAKVIAIRFTNPFSSDYQALENFVRAELPKQQN